MLKKIILLLFIFMSFIGAFSVFSYEVDLPNGGNDIKSDNIITTNTDFYINTAKKVTNYLWYIL